SVNFLHLLGYKPELRNAIGIKLFFVAECHRFQREDRFARSVHRFDVLLETLRGSGRAEAPVAIDQNGDTTRYGCAIDAGSYGFRLGTFLADADRIGLSGLTFTADVDVVTARGEIDSCRVTQGDIATASGVCRKSTISQGGIAAPGRRVKHS